MDEPLKYPWPEFVVRFCDKCGRTDLNSMLRHKHYRGGRICDGKIKWAKYAWQASQTEPFTERDR